MSGLEIVGAVASAVQLAHLSIEIITTISSLCSQIKDAPKSMQSRADQVQSLRDIAKAIEGNHKLQTPETGRILQRCLHEAVHLRDLLTSLIAPEKAGIAQKCWKAIGGLAKQKKIIEMFESLEREKTVLMLCIAQMNSTIIHDIKSDLAVTNGNITGFATEIPRISKAVHEELPLIRTALQDIVLDHRGSASTPKEEKKTTCLSSLEAAEQKFTFVQTLNRSQSACGWLFNTTEYRAWYESQIGDLLWITAGAGCGKTTLATHVIHHLLTLDTRKPQLREMDSGLGTQHSVVLYFYFHKSNQEGEGTAKAALRTIIRNFVHQMPDLLLIILERYEFLSTGGNFVWTWGILWDIFCKMLEQMPEQSTLYIILDAVDECDVESREVLLSSFAGLFSAHISGQFSKPSPKILITSRPDPCVFDTLENFPCLEITNNHTENDMQALISNRTQSFAKRRHLDDDTASSIAHFLEGNAQGMFIWVILVIEELERRDDRLTDKVIASKLSRVPLTLITTYEAILNNSPKSRRDDLWRIIRWLMYGRRTLTVSELHMALCHEVGIPKWHDFAGDIKFLCGSLIRITLPNEEISFIHQTAQDFLEAFTKKSTNFDFGGIQLDPLQAEGNLAKICLDYLLLDEHFPVLQNMILRGARITHYNSIIKNFLDHRPFFRYALENWASHIRSIGTPNPELSSQVLGLLGSEKHRDGIMRLTYYLNHYGNPYAPKGASALHLAAYFGLPWLVDIYIADSEGAAVHVLSICQDTPLIWACEMGWTTCVQKLLDAGADPNALEYDGWTPLHWACRNGHLEASKLLVQHLARLDLKDRHGHTALDWADRNGHRDVIEAIQQQRFELGLETPHMTTWTKKSRSKDGDNNTIPSWRGHSDRRTDRIRP